MKTIVTFRHKLLIVLLAAICALSWYEAHAETPPGDDDYIVCGQTVCEGPIKARIWLPMIEQGG